VVEGFHMISMPVFLSLRIGRDTSFTEGLNRYALDLLFATPAYLVIFAVIWCFINRYHFTLWHYIAIVGLGQALGDGGLVYFIKAPAMVFFLPYPMTNYQAMNIIPFLAVRDHLKRSRSESVFSWLVVPGLIGTYFICGTIIKLAGRHFGLQ